MANSELKELIIKLQRMSEKDFQTIEWEMEKIRRLRWILSEDQPRLPFIMEVAEAGQYAN